MGLAFEMNDRYGNVSYLGRGEHETYADRKQSGKIDIYNTTVERMFHYYVKPQATGNRTDVRWMKLADEANNGLFVSLVFLLSRMRILKRLPTLTNSNVMAR